MDAVVRNRLLKETAVSGRGEGQLAEGEGALASGAQPRDLVQQPKARNHATLSSQARAGTTRPTPTLSPRNPGLILPTETAMGAELPESRAYASNIRITCLILDWTELDQNDQNHTTSAGQRV